MSDLKEITERLKESIDKFTAAMEATMKTAETATENFVKAFEEMAKALKDHPPVIIHTGERILSPEENK